MQSHFEKEEKCLQNISLELLIIDNDEKKRKVGSSGFMLNLKWTEMCWSVGDGDAKW